MCVEHLSFFNLSVTFLYRSNFLKFVYENNTFRNVSLILRLFSNLVTIVRT